jgi:pimeloyl-ACP methyl ester carboxylesterase
MSNSTITSNSNEIKIGNTSLVEGGDVGQELNLGTLTPGAAGIDADTIEAPTPTGSEQMGLDFPYSDEELAPTRFEGGVNTNKDNPAAGINLWVEQLGPKDGQNVTLVHGLGMDTFYYQDLKEILAGLGYRVTVVSLRGAGKTGDPGPNDYTIEMMAQDVIGALDTLGIEKTHVVGHSMGGYVSQMIATLKPDLAPNLVLANTAPFGPDVEGVPPETKQGWKDAEEQHAGDATAIAEAKAKFSFKKGFAEQYPEYFAQVLSERAANAPKAFGKQYAATELFLAGEGTPVNIDGSKTTTTIIGSNGDRVLPYVNSQYLDARIPNSTLTTFDLGHNPVVESPRQAYLTIIDALAKHPIDNTPASADPSGSGLDIAIAPPVVILESMLAAAMADGELKDASDFADVVGEFVRDGGIDLGEGDARDQEVAKLIAMVIPEYMDQLEGDDVKAQLIEELERERGLGIRSEDEARAIVEGALAPSAGDP